MRASSALVLGLFATALALVPATSSAEGTAPVSTGRFLVAGMAQNQAPAQAQPRVQSSAPGGIGVGVKGGVLFSSFRSARDDYKNSTGWQGTLFIGGNRPGALGVMTELTYAKRGAKDGNATTDTYYLEIPLLLRMNLGSSNRNTGAILYFIGGPAVDILLNAKLDGLDVKSRYEDLDFVAIGGVGVEVSRLILEARLNWGLRNVLDGPGNELKTRSFALLGGFRFN